jgi:homopolymeric O-antigen transport system permease protein
MSTAATSNQGESVDSINEHARLDGWSRILRPTSGLLDWNLKELTHYRFLMFLFVRRDFVAQYKQTLLGPLWLILQPLFTTGIYSIIFGGLAKIPTDGIPQPVFYMAGTTIWTYFASCLSGTSTVFASNAGLFGKVYFPRLIVPITTIVTRLYTFGIQLLLFLAICIIYAIRGASIKPNLLLLLVPFIVAHCALLGLGFGLWANSLTVKYRDLSQLITFGVSLWMWVTPIVYPLSLVPLKYRGLVNFNPMAPVVELFRMAFTGVGSVAVTSYVMSVALTALVLFTGLILFKRSERSFIDIV